MKKSIIPYIMISGLSMMLVVSCKKPIDLEPTHSINGNQFFTRISDYELALTGTYTRLLQDSYYGNGNNGSGAFVGLPDMMSDNLFESSESLANYQNLSRWNYVADDPYVQDIWEDAYRVVQQANLTMRGLDNLSASSPGAVNRIKAQALALRALAHFDLLRYFGEDYDRNSSGRGIAYVDKFDVEQKPARLTVKQTYDHIEADFKTAKQLMLNMDQPIQSSGTAGSDRSYIDDLVVNGLLARMYLYANVLDSAIKYSTLVINARPLASRSVFPNIWLDASTAEVLWSVKFESFNAGIGDLMYYSVGNRASYRPTTNLLSLYDQVNDIRYPSYFRSLLRGKNRDDVTRPSRVVLIKYDARVSTLLKPDGIVNFKALRTGEMYLIRAEAYARLNNEAAANADLNTLRAARIANYTAVQLSGTALLQAIAVERRKELVGEGHRFFDLKRTGKMISRTSNCSSFCTLPPAAREWAMPVPQSEMLANPQAVQNQGY
jgi:hypothetical protein